MGLSIWTGWRYFRRFAVENPNDFEQTCALAALRCDGLSNPQAFKLISSLLIRTCREYGYSKNQNGRWMRRELVRYYQPDTDNKCGVCDKVGQHLDPRFKRLCGRHYMYVRNRIRRGFSDPYAGIENAVDLLQPRKLVRCAFCETWITKLVKRLASRPNSFCNPDCYHAWRRGERKAA